ncbi:NlpC/P60 family protein [Magnetococcus sp. PR-3]|uniref:NlpC/P60 family protein n=1 Tax=Magnetococcus sp. PR-3 TaxID=3120355 RepID=UPI002FCE28C4
MSHFAAQYIGRPWSATAEGPEAFNCWTLVRWIQQRHFNRSLPSIPISGNDLSTLARAFQNHDERQRWQRVQAAREGDCVLMRQARYPVHVGLWLDVDSGGVLHCVQGAGVVFQNLQALQQHGWFTEGYYRFKENAT